MKKRDVQVGHRYIAKVSERLVPVYIERENVRGGWDATSSVTGRSVRIRTAARLRRPATVADLRGTLAEGDRP